MMMMMIIDKNNNQISSDMFIYSFERQIKDVFLMCQTKPFYRQGGRIKQTFCDHSLVITKELEIFS